MLFILDIVVGAISAKQIADYFKSQNSAVGINTIYLEALASSFIIIKVQRYDIQGKELLKTQEKAHGIQHAVFGYRERHISGILENSVYHELVRRTYTVFIEKPRTQEIDFNAEKTKTRYILVLEVER